MYHVISEMQDRVPVYLVEDTVTQTRFRLRTKRAGVCGLFE